MWSGAGAMVAARWHDESMKQSRARHRVTSLGSTALLVSVAMAPLVACSSEGRRVPFSSSSTSETEAPDPPPPVPTTVATQLAPKKTTGDASASIPDDGCKRAAPSGECGVVPQCGCAETHTCDVVDSTGTARCITAGRAPMGHPCTATAGCALGLTCIFGTCHAFCTGPTKACPQPSTGACVQVETQTGVAIPNLQICRVACELNDPKSCGGKTNAGIGVCYVDGEGGTDCQEGGLRAESEPCSDTEVCGPGLVCTSSTSGSMCKRWCRVGQDDCGPGKNCAGLASEVNVGTVVYGVCP